MEDAAKALSGRDDGVAGISVIGHSRLDLVGELQPPPASPSPAAASAILYTSTHPSTQWITRPPPLRTIRPGCRRPTASALFSANMATFHPSPSRRNRPTRTQRKPWPSSLLRTNPAKDIQTSRHSVQTIRPRRLPNTSKSSGRNMRNLRTNIAKAKINNHRQHRTSPSPSARSHNAITVRGARASKMSRSTSFRPRLQGWSAPVERTLSCALMYT